LGKSFLNEGKRGDEVRFEGGAEKLERGLGKVRAWGLAQVGGVVDEKGDAAHSAGFL